MFAGTEPPMNSFCSVHSLTPTVDQVLQETETGRMCFLPLGSLSFVERTEGDPEGAALWIAESSPVRAAAVLGWGRGLAASACAARAGGGGEARGGGPPASPGVVYLAGLLELGSSFKRELQGFYIFLTMSPETKYSVFSSFDRDSSLKVELLEVRVILFFGQSLGNFLQHLVQ